MKYALLLSGLFVLAAEALTTREIIQKRQVSAASLRLGTRRLTARQNGPSQTPAFELSKFANCPVIQGTTLSRGGAALTFNSDTDTVNFTECIYYLVSTGQNLLCSFDANGRVITSDQPLCPSQIQEAPPTGDFCFGACPRRNNGDYLRETSATIVNDDPPINCVYTTEQYGNDRKTCGYSLTDGGFLAGPNGYSCPAALPRSTHCINGPVFTGPAIPPSRFMNCPNLDGRTLDNQGTFLVVGGNNYNNCNYFGSTSCSYDTITGAFRSSFGPGTCPAQLSVASDTGAYCFTGCQRRNGADFLIASNFIQQSKGQTTPPSRQLICFYSNRQSGGQDRRCEYDALTGAFVAGPDGYSCPSMTVQTPYCVDNVVMTPPPP